MQPLDINLATRPFRNNSLLWLGHILGAAFLLAFTAWNVRAFLSEGRDLRDLRHGMSGMEARLVDLDARDQRAQLGIRRQDVKYLIIQAKTANDVIERKALSWTLLFNLLEKVQPPEVRMASIRPVRGSGRASDDVVIEGGIPIGLEGTAQSLEAFLELERCLINDPHFDRVEPERSDITQGGEVAFEIRVLYFPDGRPDRGEPTRLPAVLAAAAKNEAEGGDGVVPDDLKSEVAPPEAAAPAPAQPAARGPVPSRRGTPAAGPSPAIRVPPRPVRPRVEPPQRTGPTGNPGAATPPPDARREGR